MHIQKRKHSTNRKGIAKNFLIAAGVSGISLLFQACGSSDSTEEAEEVRHRIFVTSTKYDANLGGLHGADAICTNVARLAGISGAYRALLSGIILPANFRLQLSGEVYLKTTTEELAVAASGSSFWRDHLVNPINVDEHGQLLPTTEHPWTATSSAGFTAGETCADWTQATTNITAVTGSTAETHSALWYSAQVARCDQLRPLFCIEE